MCTHYNNLCIDVHAWHCQVQNFAVTIITKLNHPIIGNSGAESFVPSCNISPTQHLIITERETKTITCTGPCQDKINTYFYSPNAQDNLRINIVEASIFDKIRDVNYPISDPTNTSCSNSVNFNWTQDELIRSKLPSLQCVFIFKDGAMSPCITGTISITFAGMNMVT